VARLAAGTALVVAALAGSRISGALDLARFPIAWWGIVLALDGAVRLRHGISPLARPRDLFACALASVAFWDLFELLNLRLHDWWYVGVPDSTLAGAAFSAISYATVLPAARLALALVAERPGGERIAAPAAPARAPWLALAGMAMLGAALAAPKVAFPLAWIFLWPLCESLVARLRDEGPRFVASPLQALRGGRRDLVLRAVALGLPFGLAWESLNWGCARGWVYTVPHFEGAKLFEMPLPGYLGYLPFLLECASALALVERVHGSTRRIALAALCVAGFHLGVESLGRSSTALSTSVAAGDVAALPPAERDRILALARVAHLGIDWARRLRDAGIPDPSALAQAEPGALWSRLAARGPVPPPEVVRLWVSAAARDPG
jgi:hypothetical protein